MARPKLRVRRLKASCKPQREKPALAACIVSASGKVAMGLLYTVSTRRLQKQCETSSSRARERANMNFNETRTLPAMLGCEAIASSHSRAG